MPKALTALFLAGCLLALTAASALAETGHGARLTLKGIKGVLVVVSGISPQAEKDGLKKASLQAAVEDRLRQAGIRVLTRSERFQAPGQPHLWVEFIDSKRSDMGLYTCSIRVFLEQQVRLARDPKVLTRAETWGMFGVVSVGEEKIQGLPRLVLGYVDKFIEDMLAANAPPTPAQAAAAEDPDDSPAETATPPASEAPAAAEQPANAPAPAVAPEAPAAAPATEPAPMAPEKTAPAAGSPAPAEQQN